MKIMTKLLSGIVCSLLLSDMAYCSTTELQSRIEEQLENIGNSLELGRVSIRDDLIKIYEELADNLDEIITNNNTDKLSKIQHKLMGFPLDNLVSAEKILAQKILKVVETLIQTKIDKSMSRLNVLDDLYERAGKVQIPVFEREKKIDEVNVDNEKENVLPEGSEPIKKSKNTSINQ